MKFANPSERWNWRFSDAQGFLFGEEPNAYLAAQEKFLPKGKALAIADGEGRNSVWLAQQGLKVDAFDLSPVAIEKATGLANRRQVQVNFMCSEWQSFDWKPNYYDLVAGIFFQFVDPQGRAELFQHLIDCLKPGGILIIQGYGMRQLEYKTGGPNELDHLYSVELMQELLPGFEFLDLVSYEKEIQEGTGHDGMSSLIGVVAKKPG